MILNCTGVREILLLSVWNSGLAAINQTPALFSCWPFFLTAECVCEFVCVPRVWPCLRLPVSLTGMHLLMWGGGDRRRQRLRAVASTVTAAHTNGSRRLLWPFPYTGFDTFPPSARFVSRQTVSTCYCCPPAWLRICRSVCQPASGLRREASFIKRKQAGDEDMRTVNLLEMFQRLRGSSHWKPARNILHQHWINLHSTNKLEKADNYI